MTESNGVPAIEPLNADEREWVQIHLDAAVEAGVDLSDPATVGDLFGAEYEGWASEPVDCREDPNPAVYVCGLTLGEYLRRRHGLDWVVATDHAGSEMALHRQEGEILLYPLDIAARAWETGRAGGLTSVLAELDQRLDAMTGS